jgi:hypothetical protein
MNSRILFWIIWLVTASTLIAGCNGSGQTSNTSGTQARDSAGVEILSSAQVERVLSLTEVRRIGVLEGDPRLQFARIRAIAVDAVDGIWVVDGHEGVRSYDSTGNYVGVVGSVGRGPGEAQGYARVWHSADEVLLFGFPGVLQRFSRSGEFLGSLLARTAGGSIISPLGHAQGRWFFTVLNHGTGSAQTYRPTTYIAASPDLTTEIDTLLTFPGQLSRRVSGNEIARASYFYGNPSYGIDARGQVYLSDTLRYEVSIYSPRGKRIRILRRSVPARVYDESWRAQIEEGIGAALRAGGRVAIPGERDRLVASAVPDPPPAHLPFIQRLLVSREGVVWVERADKHPRPPMRAVAHAFGYVRHAWLPEWKAPQAYDVFGASGEYVGTVQVPEDYEPMTVAGNRVYGVAYDDLGVEYVVVYEISDAAAAGSDSLRNRPR